MTTAATATLTPEFIRDLDPILFGFARRRVRSEEIARDLVQDTWLAAMGSLSRFAGRSSLRTWVISILRRKIVDHYRRGRPQVEFTEETHGSVSDADPTARIDGVRALEAVEAELATLESRERTAIEMELEGAPREEAAEALGVTRNHLRVLLHRGRGHLRDGLAARNLARAA